MTNWLIEPLKQSYITAVAGLWHDTWHEAHDHLVPPYLPSERSFERFKDRLDGAKDRIRVATIRDKPFGLCEVEGAEISQLFVGTDVRSTGLAQALLADAECRIRDAAYSKAWLTVVSGNVRARRFYEKSDWVLEETVNLSLNSTRPNKFLQLWRFEKSV